MLTLRTQRFLLTGLFMVCHLQAAERPNILWITSEDNSPYLGCYGDSQARTPNLDRMAREGVRYRHAFASAPVCSAARSTLITGMHACSVGIHNHRSSNAIPASFQLYPELLRQAGYYCTNNSKTDYNMKVNGKRGTIACWDESSNKAHYKKRKTGQPFFAVFNIGTSHEGQTTDKAYNNRRKQGLFPDQRIVSPEDVRLPPYHPDDPIVRENWSRYYDNLWLMDQQVGARLTELEEAGMADDTIVFYYADHGGALPRGKRNLHDSGTRVPLIIRFPKKWRHLAPGTPGSWIEQPVAFVDFPATLCSIVGIPVPANYEGKAFLGAQAKTQDHVFLFRGRMDERYDTTRAIRTSEYLYINNFTPHRAWGQYYTYPFRVMPSMGAWYRAWREGKCNPVQARYWQSKPGEEFYRVSKDPYQIQNLVDAKQHARTIRRLRKQLHDRIIETRDTGFIPEGMLAWLPGNQTLFDYTHSKAYPIERIVDLATHATSRNVTHLPALRTALSDPHPVIRYWATTGLLVLGKDASPAQADLLKCLDDSAADVRVVAAEALALLGETDRALPTLRDVYATGNEYEALAAINTIEVLIRTDCLPPISIEEWTAMRKPSDLHKRVLDAVQTIKR